MAEFERKNQSVAAGQRTNFANAVRIVNTPTFFLGEKMPITLSV